MLASSGLLLATVTGSWTWAAGVVALIYAVQMGWLARRTGSFSILVAPLFPLALVGFVWIFLVSVYRVRWLRRVSWKGRVFEVLPGGGG